MLEYIIIIAVIFIVCSIAFTYTLCTRFFFNGPKHHNQKQDTPKWGWFLKKDDENTNLDWDCFDIYQGSHINPPRFFQSKCVGIQPRTFEDLQKSEEQLAVSTGTLSGNEEGGKKPKIKCTLKYNTVRSILVVHVLGAQNVSKREKGDVAYYVTLRIFPQANRTFHTRAIESGTPLQFNELFEFEILEPNLLKQSLKITLSYFDRFSHHDVIGDLMVELAEVESRGLTLSREILLCKELKKIPVEQSSLGEVMLSLGYLRLTERLTVVVISARNLRHLESGRRPDPYVEVILFHGGRIIKYKKTACRVKNCNPVFNEGLTFHIPHGILHQSSLLISLKNDAGTTNNDVMLGQVLLGPEATGLEFEHWNEMRVNNKPIARWHKLHSA